MMSRTSIGRRTLATMLAAILTVGGLGAAVALAAPTCLKLAATDDIALMDEFERGVYARQACHSQLVRYEKVFIPFDVAGNPHKPIRLTHRQTARADGRTLSYVRALQAAGTDDHGLYLAVSVSRNTRTGYCSDWAFNGYFRWNSLPPNSRNSSYDVWGMTWAGDQALTSPGAAYGIDQRGTTRIHPVADVLPNEGIVWRFKEWPTYSAWVSHGYSGQSVRQRTCAGLLGNVALKYVHTYSDASVSVSIGAGNPGSISVSPVDNQWSFAQAANFTY